jgi:hypothetical protein
MEYVFRRHFADSTFWSKKTDRNKSVRPSPYFLIWLIHPTAYGGGGILGSYVKYGGGWIPAKKGELVEY